MDNAKLVVAGFNLDLPTDFGIQITKEIADVRNIESRNSDWSKTFTLPGSKINKKAFTHLFELETKIQNTSSTNFNPDFNPNLKAPARLYVDEVPQISGFIRLININRVDNHSIEFECSLHGQLSDLFANISDYLLSELNFTTYNHTLNVTNITESWDTRIQKAGANYVNYSGGLPIGEGYVYPLIDNGSFVNYYGDTHVAQFKPALYAKTIVDAIISDAGYSYTSDSFFNSEVFKRVIVPCPTGMVLSESAASIREFEALSNVVQNINSSFAKVLFDTENFDYSNQFTTGALSTFTSAFGRAFFTFYAYLNLDITGLTASNNYYLTYQLNIGGSLYSADPIIFTTNGSGAATLSKTLTFLSLELNFGDVVYLQLSTMFNNTTGIFTNSFNVEHTAGCKFYNKANASSYGLNQTVDFGGFFSDDLKQSDFLKSIFNAFNLYIEPDQDFPTKLFIATREDFYNTTVQDWSEILDIGQPLEITPMGELDANPYYFTYEKGEDDENKDYQATFDRIYGDKKYYTNNDFVRDEKKIEISFAPTQIFKASGYDKFLSYIPIKDSDGTGQLRLLIHGGTIVCNSYSIFNTPMAGTASTQTKYLCSLHIDSPTAPSIDLCFGMPRRVNLPSGTPYTDNNLFNKYWSRYIKEITDKDSKIVKGWFKISPARMERLSFRDLYYFENNYFRLNKIEDYNPLMLGVYKCEFLILSTIAAFVPSTGDIGSGGELGGFMLPIQKTIKGVDGSQLGQQGLVVGRNNGISGRQTLIVGDNISQSNENRITSVLGSTDIQFYPYVERSTVINSSGQVIEGTNKLMIQNSYVDLSGASTGDLLKYDSSTNTWSPIAATNVPPEIVSITNANSPYTVTQIKGTVLILADTTAGAITINIPTAIANTAIYYIKKIDAVANTVTIDPNGAQTIDGAATAALSSANASINFVSNNSNFFSI